MEEEILLVVPGSGILENETVMSPFVEPDAEPPDDQLYNRERDKKIAKLKTEICERFYKEKWARFCRIDLRLPEDEIKYVKERYISQDEMYENIKEFSIKDYPKFQDLLSQHGIQKSDEAMINSESGSEAEDIYRLIDYVPLKERYNLVCHTLGNKEIHSTQLHDGLLPREVMEAMLECYCERENTTYDRLQTLKDVAEMKGFLKPKQNATPDKRQKLTVDLEDKEDGEEELLEVVFQNVIIKAVPSITEFKKFARLSRGLCLDEPVIQSIVENHRGNVEEQKSQFLRTWKKQNGKRATVQSICNLLANYEREDDSEAKSIFFRC